MDLSEAAALAKSVMDEFDLNDWHLEWDRAQSRLGQTRFRTQAIGLSKAYVQLNERSTVENTIRHEVAHALAGPGHGHDGVWKRMCLVTGAKPERCATAAEATLPPARYTLRCPDCTFTCERRKRSKGRYVHRPGHGILIWEDNAVRRSS